MAPWPLSCWSIIGPTVAVVCRAGRASLARVICPARLYNGDLYFSIPDGVASIIFTHWSVVARLTVLPWTWDYKSCKPLTQHLACPEIETSSGIQLSAISGLLGRARGANLTRWHHELVDINTRRLRPCKQCNCLFTVKGSYTHSEGCFAAEKINKTYIYERRKACVFLKS